MSTTEAIKEQIRQLSVAEQIDLINEIWDELPEDQVPIPDWHLEELDHRIAKYESAPMEGNSWEDVRRSITGS